MRLLHPLGGHNSPIPDCAAVNAIFFVLQSGCQWVALNAIGIYSSTSAYRRFREWPDAGVFKEFWPPEFLGTNAPEEVCWTRTFLGKAGCKPEGLAKGGVKRSSLTEAHSIPKAMVINSADRHDMKPVKPILAVLKLHLLRPMSLLQGLSTDKGYDYDEVHTLVAEFGFTAHVRCCSEKVSAIRTGAAFRAERWAVERTQSWTNRCCRADSLRKACKKPILPLFI